MPRTLNDSFSQFKRNLEITNLQTTVVSTRQANVRQAVAREIDVLDSFLTGSYSRHTMIAPLNEADIDIFVVLNTRYYHHYNGRNGGQGGLLDFVRRVLLKTYTRTPHISRNGQAVTIHFNDFLVDVVPAFHKEGGGYIIANSLQRRWIPTNPARHVELFAQANRQHSGDLIPLIKMIKAWNKTTGSFFSSFHLEVLSLTVLERIRISDYPSGVRFFFDAAKDRIALPLLDPAGHGDDVASYLYTYEKRVTAITKFQTAYEKAIRAEDYQSRGNIHDAIVIWRRLFGDFFPTYG